MCYIPICKYWRNGQRMFLRIVGEYGPWSDCLIHESQLQKKKKKKIQVDEGLYRGFLFGFSRSLNIKFGVLFNYLTFDDRVFILCFAIYLLRNLKEIILLFIECCAIE